MPDPLDTETLSPTSLFENERTSDDPSHAQEQTEQTDELTSDDSIMSTGHVDHIEESDDSSKGHEQPEEHVTSDQDIEETVEEPPSDPSEVASVATASIESEVPVESTPAGEAVTLVQLVALAESVELAESVRTDDNAPDDIAHTGRSVFSPFVATSGLPTVSRMLTSFGNGLYGPGSLTSEQKSTGPMPAPDGMFHFPLYHSSTTLLENPVPVQTGPIVQNAIVDDIVRPRITLPLPESSSYRMTGHFKRKLLTRAINRYGRMSLTGKMLLIVLLFAVLLPTLLTLFVGFNTYVLYRQAQSGLEHIQRIETIFHGGSGSSAAKYLDINKLRQAQVELNAAHASFVQVHDGLTQNSAFMLIGSALPQQMSSMRALSAIAIDATTAGQQLVPSLITLSPLLTPNLKTPFSSSLMNSNDGTQKPLLTPQIMNEVAHDIDLLTPLVHDMYQQSRNVDVSSLPLNQQQSDQLLKTLVLLPQINTILPQVNASLPALNWFLGVGQPRTFLVQTMDRAELRATGGFTGQFSPLTFDGARMSQLQLKNIGPYEEIVGNQEYDATTVNKVAGKDAPAPYDSWWPIDNFGMRDSNVSADFPTSAQITMHQYKYEFGSQVEGLIVFSPFLITRVLQITGPVKVPVYNETITAQNLESRLHYYQLDGAGIAKEQSIEHVKDTGQARKLFTQRLSKIIINTVEHLPFDQLMRLANQMLYSMKTKDLQVYADNSTVEGLIAKYGSTASIDRSTQHDGLYVVQTNLSANKASQYVQTNLQDTVSLNDKGGATHVLQIKLVYNQQGPVYGPDTYHDFVRIYVPPTSQYLWGNGFDQGYDHPLCGGDSGLNDCSKYDVYGNGRLLCPAGMTQSGQATSTDNDPYAGENHPINKIGAPTDRKSDETGRAMYGGWLVVPKNCTLLATVSWYVPPQGQQPYSLLVQRQSSTFPQLDLTILPTSSACATLKTGPFYYSGVLATTDMTFTPPALKKTAGCYPAVQP